MKLDEEGPLGGSEEGGISPGLRAMVAELRAEEPRDLPWDSVERRLMVRLARGEGGRPPAAMGTAMRMLAPLCAAAAGIALLISVAGESPMSAGAPVEAPTLIDASRMGLAPGAAGERGDRELSRLRAGTAVETGDAPVVFTRVGVVRWELAPHSRAVVLRSGARSGVGMVVSLERGALRAEVEPRDADEGLVEAFAVEAGGTRVAVHGTVFSVARGDEKLVVDVERGVVAVGPAGHRGVTAGYSLVGPARASFSLDGGATARFLPSDGKPLAGFLKPLAGLSGDVGGAAGLGNARAAERGVAEGTAEGTAVARGDERREEQAEGAAADHGGRAMAMVSPRAVATAAARAPSEAPAAPAAPEVKEEAPAPQPAAPALLTQGIVKGRIEGCIKRAQSDKPLSMKVSIASTLTVNVGPDGSVISARLNPPLAPHLQSCAGQGISGKFASGPQTLTIPLSVVEE